MADDVDDVRVRRRAWTVWGVLVLAAVGVLLALPLLLLFDLSNALDDSADIPDDVRTRLERIESDRAFRSTPPGATEVDAGMSAGSCDGSHGAPANVWRNLELSGSPARLASRMTEEFTENGWTATPSSSTVVAFDRRFGSWSGHVVLVVERRGAADLTGWIADDVAACEGGGID